MNWLSAFALLFSFLVFHIPTVNGCSRVNLQKDCTSCNSGHRFIPYFGLCFQISTKSMQPIEGISGSHRWTVQFLDSNMARQKNTEILEQGCEQALNNKCVRCGSRYYKLDKTCRLIGITCESWDTNTGECQRCFSGFSLLEDQCILQDWKEEENYKIDEERKSEDNIQIQIANIQSPQQIRDENQVLRNINNTVELNSSNIEEKLGVNEDQQKETPPLDNLNKLNQNQISNSSIQSKQQPIFNQSVQNSKSSLKDLLPTLSENQSNHSSSESIKQLSNQAQVQKDLNLEKRNLDLNNQTGQENQQSIDPENRLPGIVNENINIDIVQLLNSFPFHLYDSSEIQNKTISNETEDGKNEKQYNNDGEFSLDEFLQSLPQNKETDRLSIRDFSHLSSSSIFEQIENNETPPNPGYIYYV